MPPKSEDIYYPIAQFGDGYYYSYEFPLVLHLNEGYNIGDTLVYVSVDSFPLDIVGKLDLNHIDLKSINVAHPQGLTHIHSNLTQIVQNDYDVHPNGWIVFSTWDKFIFKIKVNGDSITYLSQDFSNNPFNYLESVNWNCFGNKILVTYFPGNSYIMDINGSILEYLPNLGVSPKKAWGNKRGYFLTHNSDSIYYLDSLWVKHNIMKRPANGIQTLSWIGDTKFAYSIPSRELYDNTSAGLYFADAETGENHKVLDGCESEFVTNVCYSPKVDRIYFLRCERIPVDKYTIHTRTTICSMRSSGTDFKEHPLQ
jgi:hypothetical protein